jgi:hypothetical protein
MLFDDERSTELLADVVRHLVQSQKLETLDPDWVALTAVFTADDGAVGAFGYAYLEDDSWAAFAPGSGCLTDVMEMRDAMQVTGEQPWVKCRLQVVRNTGQVTAKMQYKGQQEKWTIDASNLEETVLSLKPQVAGTATEKRLRSRSSNRKRQLKR